MSTFEVWYSDGSVSLPKVAIGNRLGYTVSCVPVSRHAV